MKRLLRLANVVRAQLALLAFLGGVQGLVWLGALPEVGTIIERLGTWLDRGGLPLVALTSFGEGLLGVNVYFPGSVVILAAMSRTHGNPSLGIATWLTIMGSSQVTQLINFSVGLATAPRDPHAQKESPKGRTGLLFAIFMTSYWHPHLAAVASYGAGSRRTPWSRFLVSMIPASFVWNSFWAVAMYFFGGLISTNTEILVPVTYAYVVGWLVVDVVRFLRARPHKEPIP
jgi:membrane protein DedA with SNARE-associated domain